MAMLVACAWVGSAPRATAGTADSRSKPAALPPYEFGYTNGLYATIAGFVGVKDVQVRDQRKYDLRVPSFRSRIPIRAVVQSGSAPLVVVLMGIDGKADSPFGKLWPSWYSEAGYHVLTFDSTFLASFVGISGHGVTGNLQAETERVRDIIAAFLEMPEMQGKVSKIGLVGMSYGGIEALLLGQMARDGKLPFQVAAIQAYSPPLKLHRTGELIDYWFAVDRWQFTLIQLSNKMTGHKPVPPGAEVPLPDSMMRAGMAAIFRIGLAEVVLKNNEVFSLGALPKGDQFNDKYQKKAYAESWGYHRFMYDMSYPYWQRKLSLGSINEMTAPVEVARLLEKQPAWSEVILAQDDPLNDPADLAELKPRASSALTVLPRGGHLGFVSDPWTKAKLLALFNPLPSSAATKAGY